ncbi:preprotein translocase subunit SecG [Pollutimonas harenae]|uniref:Protein-export membrane protein SecG n=1 Tax=Pollutimonas harenae TaxID=657015 RepID=A0A853GXI4_9BURK|nr:preprotein translocase subunit SecG [Pollutimonas harenae]NYT85456.1 preprotein translocase subunit SecG [Pollutimonas harenae]TEA70550.1 preprotein translocase subunit SecG [Pollutimonas harenae]
MQWLSPVLMAIQVISSLSVIVLVLLQQGKGADMGASFGGGSAGSLFGATGAANFLSRTTKWAAVIFFASTGALAWVAHHPTGAPSLIDGGVMQGFQSQEVPVAPGSAVPGAAPSGSAVPSAPAPAPAAPESSAVPQAPAQSGPATESSAPAQSGPATEPSAAPASQTGESVPAAPASSN